MTKKRSLALLLILAMMVSVFAVGCGGNDAPAEEPVEEGEEVEGEDSGEAEVPAGDNQIIVGNGTEMSGDFHTAAWQNNAADAAVRDLIADYGLVGVDLEGEFHVNETVVEDYEVIENEDGTKTYEWTIVDDLVYSNGDEITAKDYAASFALFAHPVIAEMNGKNTTGTDFVGWNEYSKGETNVFEGIKLIDDYTISMTFAADKVPYYYELASASAGPTHLESWLGDSEVEVADDGEGIYLTKEITKDEYEEAINAARFATDNPVTGAYYIKDYDEASKTVVLEINDKFKGTWDGQKPSIQTVIQKKVAHQTKMDELSTGSVDVLHELGAGDEINAGFDLMDEEDVDLDFFTYPRSGYGKLIFSCDFGPTGDVEVRQALAHLLDRNEFAKSFTGGYGSVVHGPYGEGSWFYQETKDELEEQLNEYPYDVDKAIELLEEAGWVLDENGNDYESGIRYKKNEDGELEPLIINWASTEDNDVSDLLVISLQENPDLAEAGIKIEQTTMDFSELLNYMYRDGSKDDKYGVPTYHMFNLASNFGTIYDQSKAVTTDPELIAMGWNDPRIFDEELEQAAIDMVYVDPEDRDLFLENFIKYIVRWNELLPELPLYSNELHSFFNSKLKGYEASHFRKGLAPLIYCTVE